MLIYLNTLFCAWYSTNTRLNSKALDTVLWAIPYLQWSGRELCSRPETDTSYSLWFLIVAGIAGIELRVGVSMFSCGKITSISYWIQVLKGNPWSSLYFNISQKRNGNELRFQMFSQSFTRGDKVYILCWNTITFLTNWLFNVSLSC